MLSASVWFCNVIACEIHVGNLNFIGFLILLVFSLPIYFDFRALLNSTESVTNFWFMYIYVA